MSSTSSPRGLDRLTVFLEPRATTDTLLGVSDLGAQIIATSVIMTVLAILWTGMRVWARLNRRVSPFVVEDILCYWALAFQLGFAANVILLAAIGGAGHHLKEMSPAQYGLFAKLTFSSQFFYAMVVGLVKVSITWNMKRIFSVPGFQIAAYVVIACSIAWALQTMLVPIFLCAPISYNWDASVDGKCGDSMLAYTSVSVVDIVTDALVLLLPIKPLARLHIQKAYKIALLAVFGSVIITMVLTAVRIYIVYNIDYTDLPYAGAASAIISSVQTGVAIMIASSPLLRPVFDRTIGSWLGLSLRSTGRGVKSGTTDPGKTQRSRMTSGRRASRNFEQIKDSSSDQELGWEMHGIKDPRVFTETTVHASRGRDHDDNPPTGILVTESTIIARAI